MKLKIIRLEEKFVPYVEIPAPVCDQLGWSEGDELNFEPVVDKQGKITHVILEKTVV